MYFRLLTVFSTFLLLLKNYRVWCQAIGPFGMPISGPVPPRVNPVLPLCDPYGLPPNFPNYGLPSIPPPLPPPVFLADTGVGRDNKWLNFIILLFALRNKGGSCASECSSCGDDCGNCSSGCSCNSGCSSSCGQSGCDDCNGCGISKGCGCNECGCDNSCNNGCGSNDGCGCTNTVLPYSTPIYDLPVTIGSTSIIDTTTALNVASSCAASAEDLVVTSYPTVQTIPGRSPNEVYLIIRTECNS